MAEGIASAIRSPLAEAAHRINSPIIQTDKPPNKSRNQKHELQDTITTHAQRPAVHQVAPDARVSATMNDHQSTDQDKRMSQASYASTSSSRSKRNYKTHIGPWQLGRTLGKGSSARVRLCRHNLTNQLAAVKIVNRRMAYLVQDSSLAALTKWDSHVPEPSDGHMRVPMAIEREVAILKLIEHPNIMKLYDIWENRSEIYLILEYIDHGDLFTFINSKGRLSEEVTIYFFRQMISAIAYCHSFNVCHRDLKPENILITADLQIKICDFGMAALHQTATHQLATACGSPHYAAPELLKNRQYRGDKADIWSLGVILYAMLSATLPFDDPDLRVMMGKTKKGVYEMPSHISPEAEDLIDRMLQVNPDRRINLQEIWEHPLVQRYSYQDDFGDFSSQMVGKGFKQDPVPRGDIDPQLLRQLRSMWHMFSEQDLSMKLSCEEPNDQKAFYWLLHDYRNKQLEDFKPELAHSMSDYHHMKPSIWKKRVSTCQFSQPRVNGHGRSISRFTVISNAAEGDDATVVSYDPYRSSGRLQNGDSQVTQAKVVVHRDGVSPAAHVRVRSSSNINARQLGTTATKGSTAASKGSTTASKGSTTVSKGASTTAKGASTTTKGSTTTTKGSITARPASTRGSMSSLHSRHGSRHGTPSRPQPNLRHKRVVDFSHMRKRSNSASRNLNVVKHRTSSANSMEGAISMHRVRGSSKMPVAPGNYSSLVAKNASVLFRDELRNFSNDIARNCDEAFRSSLMDDDSVMSDVDKRTRDSTPFSLATDSPSIATEATDFSSRTWQHRPLPPLPGEDGALSGATTSVNFSRPGSGEDYRGDVGGSSASIDTSRQADRRAVSAPTYGYNGKKATVLPSINENTGVNNPLSGKARVVSTPETTTNRANTSNGNIDLLSKNKKSIRMVVDSPVGVDGIESAPTAETRSATRKLTKEDPGRKLHMPLAYNAERADEAAPRSSSEEAAGSSGVRKMRSWFRRMPKTDSERDPSPRSIEGPKSPALSYSSQEPQPASTDASSSKKRAFGFSFWKNGRGQEPTMTSEAKPAETDRPQLTSSKGQRKNAGVLTLPSSGSGGQRNIEVKQSWMTRLLRVKPATSYVCMNLSRRRARQEVAILLREWRRYGIRDIYVDKQRNVIFARVAAKNYLNIKEVDVAAEVMTVIEHGKRQPLSIVRFTQERGAASSFHRVVDTMRLVFDSRNLLVADCNKQKMMIKTLAAAS